MEPNPTGLPAYRYRNDLAVSFFYVSL